MKRIPALQAMEALKTTIDDLKDDTYYLCQPKINGIRATWNPEKRRLSTKGGLTITSVPHITTALLARDMPYPLDGELYSHTLPFEDLNGLVRMERATERSKQIAFFCFDIAMPDTPNEERFELLSALDLPLHIKTVPTYRTKSKTKIQEYYDSFLKQGYEGIILRDPNARYMAGMRGDWVLKIKPVHEVEAKLVGFVRAGEESRHVATFGSLQLELANGKRFKCSNMPDKVRARLWREKPIGQWVTVMYGTLSKNGVPVFPRFKAIRWDQGGCDGAQHHSGRRRDR